MKRIESWPLPFCIAVLVSCNAASNSDPVYEAFRSNAVSNRIDLNEYSGYTVEYVNQRAQLFCQLMDGGELVKLTTQLSFGDTPGGLFSKADKDGILQKMIWRSATPILCPQHNQYLQPQQPVARQDVHKWYAGARYVGSVSTGNLVWQCDNGGTCVLEGPYKLDLNMDVCRALSSKVGGLTYYSNDGGMIWGQSSHELQQCNGG